jgi:hypothetical protein
VDEGAFREERRTTQLAMFVPPISNKPRERSEHLAPAASCVQEELVKPLAEGVTLRHSGFRQIRRRRRRPTNIAASGASNQTQRPLRERNPKDG